MIADLKKLKAEDLGKVRETDVYLVQGDKRVRVRKFGKKGLVTLKVDLAKKVKAKVKQEIQSEVDDAQSIIRIFEMLGFKKEWAKEKIRHTFRLGDSLVLLDRLPFLGLFIEIESSSAPKLKRIAQMLELNYKEASCASYNELFLNYIGTNKRLSNAAFTFKDEESFKKEP
jgi:predicted adenylyl cyclase CyaB